MQKIIAAIILTLIITNIVTANKEVTAQLNNIYLEYSRGDFINAEQNLHNLIVNSIPKTRYFYLTELGDLYLDKLEDYHKAESIYTQILVAYPKEKNLSDIYYRLGITYEKMENFLKAAQMYEMVATKYHNAQYAPDALDAIERCFKKNYQDVVAKIDAYPITRIEFDDRLALAPGNYDTYEKKQQLLNDMINERVMNQEARKRGYDQMLDFKDRIADTRKNAMFQNWYQREVINKININDKQKKQYYAKNKQEFITPEQASAREILVLTKPEADSVYQYLLANPTQFESIAQVKSIAPSKSNGGNLGLFRRGTYPEEIENVIFKLKPGVISMPVYSESKGGYAILQLEELRPRKERAYKEVTSDIENRLRAQTVDETFKTKTEAFRKASQVTVIDSALKLNLDVVAMIDNEMITQNSIADYISRIPPFYRSEFETPEGKKRILDQIILEKTWLRQLEKEKYWLLNAVFSIIEENKRSNLINNLRKAEVTDKVFVAEEDEKAVYKKNLADYKVPKQIRVREISLSTDSAARAIRKAIVSANLPFDSLAREHSIAPTKRMGGDIGFFSLGTKSKLIEDAALKLKVGQVSSVLKQNDSTYTIIKLEEIKPAYTKTFDEVKPTIQRKLRQEKDQQRYQSFLNEIRSQYTIENYLVDDIPIEQIPNELENK